MTDFAQISQVIRQLVENISPASRAKLLKEIGTELRTRQQKRITAQQNPDGSAFTPRKNPTRDKKGRIKRKMFSKIKTARHLKLESTSEQASITFVGNSANIARVHHFGQTEKGITYPSRQLLGINEEDIDWIENRILEKISL